MRVLVIGDLIIDHYKWCKAVKLAPEACAPVLQVEKENISEGGASLVAQQLCALREYPDMDCVFGSKSEKHRIFAERTLICRIDRDSYHLTDPRPQIFNVFIHRCDIIVVSDYGKGTFDEALARDIVNLGFPTFVDSKHHIEWWKGATYIFPNEHEHNGLVKEDFPNIIRKLGAKGCSVNEHLVPTESQLVYDVTGAGDVFMAAFVHKYTLMAKTPCLNLIECAKYANKVAGVSVRHMGTYVVKPEEVPE